jgi:clan AA aspartic protease (TIGR02281 family)
MRTLGAALVAAAAFALSGCGHNTNIATDEFMTDTEVDGPLESTTNGGLGDDQATYRLVSFVAKAEPHAVSHQAIVKLYARNYFSGVTQEARYDRAADETGIRLKLVGLGSERCPGSQVNCLKAAVVKIELADEALRQHVLSGYRIKVEAQTGRGMVLSFSPRVIQQQLSAVDTLVAGAPDAPAREAPRLGIGVIGATAAPFDGPPHGVIVVATGDHSPAAAAGVRPGDVLLAINGEPIRVSADVGRLMSAVAPGQGITLAMKRGTSLYSAKLDDALRLVSVTTESAAAAAPAHALQSAGAVAGLPAAALDPGQKIIALAYDGGTYVVPVVINDAITLNFVVDSGASEVSIPEDVASTLARAGTIAKEDFLGSQTYVLADGHKMPSQRFRIRSLKIGDIELRDVTASIAPAKGALLLGQSFLSRLKSWSIDNARHALIVN